MKAKTARNRRTARLAAGGGLLQRAMANCYFHLPLSPLARRVRDRYQFDFAPLGDGLRSAPESASSRMRGFSTIIGSTMTTTHFSRLFRPGCSKPKCDM